MTIRIMNLNQIISHTNQNKENPKKQRQSQIKTWTNVTKESQRREIALKQILWNKNEGKINRGRQVKPRKQSLIWSLEEILFKNKNSFDNRGKRNGNYPTQPLKLGKRVFVHTRSCFYSPWNVPFHHYEMLANAEKNENVRQNQKCGHTLFHHPLLKLK